MALYQGWISERHLACAFQFTAMARVWHFPAFLGSYVAFFYLPSQAVKFVPYLTGNISFAT